MEEFNKELNLAQLYVQQTMQQEFEKLLAR